MTPKKSVNFSFRLTPAEKRKLKSLARKSGLSMTDYIMRSALGKEIKVVPGLDEMARQLKAIGNNLNQLTYRANAGKTVVVGLDDTADALAGIWDALAELTAEEN